MGGTWEAGGFIGPDFYYGDLNVNKFLPNKSVSLAGGAYITRQFTNVIGLRAQLMVGGLRGARDVQDVYLGHYTARFQGVDADFTVNAVLNVSNVISPYHSGRRVFVYLLGGIGVSVWNTKLWWDVAGSRYDPPQENGPKVALVFPLGAGLQVAVNRRIRVGAEFTIRTITSDLVDKTESGFKLDIVNLLAFSASYRFGLGAGAMNVHEYMYSQPYKYQPKPYDTLKPPAPAELAAYAPQTGETFEYVVQICAYARHNYSVSWVKKHYHVNLTVLKESENGLNRYIIGTYFKDLNEAKNLCDRLRKQGIRDAWVIAYKNGQRHHVIVY